MDILISNVMLNGERKDISITGGMISRISPGGTSLPSETVKIIEGKDKAAFPFLHNGHTHSPMVLLRGIGEDMPLHDWLFKRIFPTEARLTEEDYYWGNRFALLEMIKSGTGFFNEMYMHPEPLIRNLRDYPLKAWVSFPIIDGGDEKAARSQIEECLRFFEKTDFPPNVKPVTALHSVYANSPYSIKWVGDFARAGKLPIHIHLSETEKEVEDCKKEHDGMSPVEYLESLDFFRDNRVFAAHCVWLEEKDMDIMAGSSVTAIYNPVSNMKLAAGQAFPFNSLKSRNIPMVLGTDGAASNNNLDIFEEMKIAALLQKHHFRDATLMKAREVFAMAGEEAAKIFGTGSGKIEEGNAADLMLLRTDDIALVPGTDMVSNLVYSANGSAVSDLFCGGEQLMKDGFVEGEEEIKKNAAQCAARLVE